MNTLAGIRECSLCGSEFPIYEEDFAVYDRWEVPPPDLCFECRLQYRMAFYNRRSLYRRSCDFSGKTIVSMYSPDKPYQVYEKNIWYSDKWNPLDYGRDFDFSRPFFEQFAELMSVVPHLSLAVIGENINSDFTNDNQRLKNCYLSFDCSDAENVLYSETFINLRDCMDLLICHDCELCYECVQCSNCYNLKYSDYCKTCSDSWFLRDCSGCSNCFGCANLQQKQYHLFNKPCGKEEYQAFIEKFRSQDYRNIVEMRQRVKMVFADLPLRATRGTQNQNVLGNNVSNSKNAFWCFNSVGLEDCRYCSDILMGAKDCMDLHVWGENTECCYNSSVVGEHATTVFCSCFIGVGCRDIWHSAICTRNCADLFGCFGLQHQQYGILNKIYSKQDFEELRGRIKAHMQETGEWGQFFPPAISSFGYNESMAQASYPLSKSEVLERGWKWSDFEPDLEVKQSIEAAELPDSLDESDQSILQTAIICEVSGRPFRITKSEFQFYTKHKLPLPRRHPDIRHADRMKLRRGYALTLGECGSCGKTTSFCNAEDEIGRMVCNQCYRDEVY
jgi:hypothetical protein